MTPQTAQRFVAIILYLSSLSAVAQTSAVTLPAGTPLPVQIPEHLAMRAGEPIRAQLLYPVYADNAIALPEKTLVTGTVTKLQSNHSRRIQARLNGDFTPFHIPVVHFSAILLPDGTRIPIATSDASEGAPVMRLTAPPPQQGGFIRRQWNAGLQILKDRISVFTAPEKGDRLLQFFYHQLPYHPERIEEGTAWTVEITEAVSLPQRHVTTSNAPPDPPAQASDKDSGHPTWIVQAYLKQQLDSNTAKSGQPIQAIVAEPVFNPDHSIAVPQGAIVNGAITQAKPARSFGRAGTLGFDFRSITLPSGQTQNVQAAITGADSDSNAKLAMNSEGKVKPKPQDKIVVPLLLGLLATRPLDEDVEGGAGRNFVGANGFGLAGNLIALAGGSSNFAAGIGAYGTAVAIYRRWIAHGHDVSFARDTRIVVQATPRSSAVLKTSTY
jgi:hypothetical protein